MIAPALRKIAERLQAIAAELEAGHIVPSDDVRLEVRRLAAQAEMMDSCA
jgi:hypothetical protein